MKYQNILSLVSTLNGIVKNALQMRWLGSECWWLASASISWTSDQQLHNVCHLLTVKDILSLYTPVRFFQLLVATFPLTTSKYCVALKLSEPAYFSARSSDPDLAWGVFTSEEVKLLSSSNSHIFPGFRIWKLNSQDISSRWIIDTVKLCHIITSIMVRYLNSRKSKLSIGKYPRRQGFISAWGNMLPVWLGRHIWSLDALIYDLKSCCRCITRTDVTGSGKKIILSNQILISDFHSILGKTNR